MQMPVQVEGREVSESEEDDEDQAIQARDAATNEAELDGAQVVAMTDTLPRTGRVFGCWPIVHSFVAPLVRQTCLRGFEAQSPSRVLKPLSAARATTAAEVSVKAGSSLYMLAALNRLCRSYTISLSYTRLSHSKVNMCSAVDEGGATGEAAQDAPWASKSSVYSLLNSKTPARPSKQLEDEEDPMLAMKREKKHRKLAGRCFELPTSLGQPEVTSALVIQSAISNGLLKDDVSDLRTNRGPATSGSLLCLAGSDTISPTCLGWDNIFR